LLEAVAEVVYREFSVEAVEVAVVDCWFITVNQ
jgi:hypothetical protein